MSEQDRPMNLFGITDGLKVKGGDRVGGDAYYSPIPLVRAVVPLLGIKPGDVVLESSAGGGAWARELAEAGAHVHALDIDPNAWVNIAGRAWSDRREAERNRAAAIPDHDPREAQFGKLRTRCVDFMEYPRNQTPPERLYIGHTVGSNPRPFHWGVGNPPFDGAEAHARHELELCDKVAFLLRGGFLASAERVPFWEEFRPHLTDVWFLQQRPTEWDASYDYAMLLWDQTQRVTSFRGHLLSWR